MMKWIPTEWMTPDKTGAYLVTVNHKGMFGTGVIIGQWEQPQGQLTFDYDNKGKWKWMAQNDVVAWMPLPEPYSKAEPQTEREGE